MKRLIPSSLIFTALLTLSFSGDGLLNRAEARIYRSCTAEYQVHVLDQWWNYVGKTTAYTFTARGGCGNLVPNRCRRRARETAKACMQDHYTNELYTGYPWNDRPYDCDVGGIQTYYIHQLVSRLRQAACSVTSQSGTYVVYTRAHVSGKRWCHTNKLLTRPNSTHPEYRVIYCP